MRFGVKAPSSPLRPGPRNFLLRLDRTRLVRVGRQFIAMRMGMRMVPGRQGRFFLRMMGGMRVWGIEGMVLFQFTVPVLIRAGLGPGKGGFGIIGLAVGSMSWCHGHTICSFLLNPSGGGGIESPDSCRPSFQNIPETSGNASKRGGGPILITLLPDSSKMIGYPVIQYSS